jgi:hypothetical protein
METSHWVAIIAAIITAAGGIIAVMIEDDSTPPTPINNSMNNNVIPTKENMMPTLSGLTSREPSPSYERKAIHWKAAAYDPEDDLLLYKFLVNGEDQTGWITDETWTWDNTEDYIGDNQIDVWVRDSKHTDPNNFDDHKSAKFTIEVEDLPEFEAREGFTEETTDTLPLEFGAREGF